MDYQPLDPNQNEIRLLTFLNAKQSHLPVHCTCGHFSLQALREPERQYDPHRSVDVVAATATPFRFHWGDYIALSYVWGAADIANQRTIFVDGNPVKVTKNLEAALRQLRESPEVIQGLKLWVDAVCINQGSIPERNNEVKRMLEIYRSAFNVIVWVGPESGDTSKAFRLVQQLSQLSRELTHPTQIESAWRRGPHPFHGSLQPLLEFWQQPYWKRLWIIQELAMGGDTTPILCGQQRTSWRQLSDAANFIANAYTNISKSITQEVGEDNSRILFELVWLISQIFRLSVADDRKSQRNHLQRLLRLVQGARATDPKDLVYGILGLLPVDISSDVIPNYADSEVEVYTAFTKVVLENTERLNLILMGNRAGLAPNWPSWVPDWRNGFDYRSPAFDSPYEAGGDWCLGLRFDRYRLFCLGFRLPIDAVTTPNPITSAPDAKISKPARSGHQFGEEEWLVQKYWMHVLPSSVTNNQQPGLLSDTNSSPLERFLVGTFSGQQLSHGNAKATVEESMVALEELSIVVEVLKNRPPIAVIRGYIVFSAYGFDATTDILCILFGCGLPVILRAEGQYYKIIGECYIYQLMQGEAHAWTEDGSCVLEEFGIC